ncbi:MAG: amidohydrolase family protein [Planctomycetota bacterium]|nr:amidohydrolase family protein [Planctomycetota bacterium]
MKTPLLLLPLLAVTVGLAEADDKYAIKAGTVLTMAGDPITNGVIVIEGGRITAIGSADEVKIPWDAAVLDASDLTAAPGFVEAYTSSGMDRPNENVELAPYLNIRDSIDPVSFYFEDSLRAGVTTLNVQQGAACVIGGMGMVVQPFGLTVEEMLVRPNSGLIMSAAPKSGKSRATQAQALREAFGDLRRHLEQLVQEKRDGNDRARREALYQGRDLSGERGLGRAMVSDAWTVEGLELVPRGEIDEKMEPLLDVVEGTTDVYFYCGSPVDVHQALAIARDNGFLASTTLVLDASCWKAADLIKEAGVQVVLDPALTRTERDPRTGEEDEVFIPGVFAEKGITFALSSRNTTNESMWFQVATCIANGMSVEDAWAAATTSPAAMLGLDGRVGSLRKGADGDVVLYSGDPLSISSHVEFVVLDGKLVYDRSKDIRTKHLLEGIQPEGGSADEASDEGDK